MEIALLSDTHLIAAEPAFDANLAAVRAWIEQRRIALTCHLGDVTADGAIDPDQLDHAARQLAGWPGELRILAGNHDIGDNPGDHGHPIATAEGIERFRTRFGAGRWSLDREGWRLIGIDAQLLGRDDALEHAQQAWLAPLIAGHAGPIGLFLHKPLFRDGPADRSRHHRYVPHEARDRLLASLAGADLRFVVSGHTHQSRRLHIGGVEHVWVPSAAFILPDAAQETIGVKQVGVMMLTLRPDGYEFAFAQPEAMRHHDLADHAHIYPAHEAELRAMARDAGR
jgi:3',5'-cyclic AMP phosphodiesterase CpdA